MSGNHAEQQPMITLHLSPEQADHLSRALLTCLSKATENGDGQEGVAAGHLYEVRRVIDQARRYVRCGGAQGYPIRLSHLPVRYTDAPAPVVNVVEPVLKGERYASK